MGRPVHMAPSGREVPPGWGSPSYGCAPHPPRGWPLVRSSQLGCSCLSPELSCGTPTRSLACGRGHFSDLLHNRRERLEVALIDVAPTPLLAALIRHDDRVRRGSEVFGRVLVLGVIAAADVAAAHTQPQVDPRIAELETFLTAIATRRHNLDLVKMCTGSHVRPPWCLSLFARRLVPSPAAAMARSRATPDSDQAAPVCPPRAN